MSHSKKTRRIKGKLDIKTGSKKSFINSSEMGKMPSKNKLAKHKNRQKSAYQKSIESQDKSADKESKSPDASEIDEVQE